MGATPFERMGGEPVLRAVIRDFVGRVFDDPMIGFFFRRASRDRIERLEYELAAEFLGAPVRYSGRPLDVAHAPHPIRGGHFARRRELLRRTLVEHQVPQDIIAALLAHTDALRALVTPDRYDGCDPEPASDARK
ncbi:MAG: group 1 truncated hemoglobin [Myxococcota bacterium]|nr:group 1 truncated hemoglobin [Myxococcota bacterium]